MAKKDQYLKHLSEVPMFEALNDKELQQLARLAEDMRFEAGTELIKEGATGREFFVIAEGQAGVFKGEKKVATLGPGGFFGELALLDPAPRNATVKAETNVEVVLMGQREFLGLLSQVPALANKVLKGMAKRLREMDEKVVQ